jgi:hydroxymethylpyrimidine pyrophosphatase-like HAD family hydrolase
MSKTIFCDIDGTILDYPDRDPLNQVKTGRDCRYTPGAREKLLEWVKKDYTIVLTTGRKESARVETERQLAEKGIMYDHLIMGISTGQRVLINDSKPDSDEPTAIAIVVERNKGLESIYI